MRSLSDALTGKISYFWFDFKPIFIFYLIFLIVIFSFTYLVIRWHTKSSLRVISFNILLLSFLFLQLFLGLEIYYRYIFDDTDNVLQIKTTQRWIDRHVRINAYSFRNDHFFKDKDSKELRLAAIGDSYTYGYGIKDENLRYSNLLENKLNQSCSPNATAKVYNMARPGLNTTEQLEVLKIAKDHNVDGVILGYTLDDARSNRTPRHTDVCYNKIFQYKKNPFLKFIIEKSFAVEYFYIRIYNLLFAKTYSQACWSTSSTSLYQDPEIWIRHLDDLKSFIDYCRRHSIGLAVAIFPSINIMDDNYPLSFVHNRLSSFLSSNNIPVIDLFDSFSNYPPEQLMVSSRDFHANQLGHQLAADSIYETIKSLTWANCKQ